MSGKVFEIKTKTVFKGSTRSMLPFNVHHLSAHQNPQFEDFRSRGILGRRILWWRLFCKRKHGIVSKLVQKDNTMTTLRLCIGFFALSILTLARPVFRAPSSLAGNFGRHHLLFLISNLPTTQ